MRQGIKNTYNRLSISGPLSKLFISLLFLIVFVTSELHACGPAIDDPAMLFSRCCDVASNYVDSGKLQFQARDAVLEVFIPESNPNQAFCGLSSKGRGAGCAVDAPYSEEALSIINSSCEAGKMGWYRPNQCGLPQAVVESGLEDPRGWLAAFRVKRYSGGRYVLISNKLIPKCNSCGCAFPGITDLAPHVSELPVINIGPKVGSCSCGSAMRPKLSSCDSGPMKMPRFSISRCGIAKGIAYGMVIEGSLRLMTPDELQLGWKYYDSVQPTTSCSQMVIGGWNDFRNEMNQENQDYVSTVEAILSSGGILDPDSIRRANDKLDCIDAMRPWEEQALDELHRRQIPRFQRPEFLDPRTTIYR